MSLSTFFPSLPHVEDCAKRIRVYHKGVCLIDTKKAKFIWLHPYYPVYGFLKADLPSWYLKVEDKNPAENATEVHIGLTVGGDPNLKDVITFYLTGPLEGLATIKFDAVDAWFEEDEQIFLHPRDPYKRIDILQSSRHVRVEVNGVEIANTRAPRLLFETGLMVRTYIPKTDCRMDLWQPSTLTTKCPYKGTANYYSVVLSSGETFEDIVWWYPTTTHESSSILGFVVFYDEKVDVWVDGEKQERPAKPSV
ncbi:hypothetical protein GALMADRAFT_256838 [Galerina marginata CBS 339.88]|uniref:DUF427 domain-containing protein n=1 Tax=Galerina marginata (strain CBS 339.88) TaxID=685588 RepID=A0A067SCB8_GALM3|nr:hypothetical protein GALMADRAFT_256838 [Galerina marginata CBS 339.88]